MYIYKITNLINKKIYIGQTIKTLEERCIFKGNSYNTHLIRSVNKYGIENFKIEQLCKCGDQLSLGLMEDLCIILFDSINPEKGYNMKRGGIHGKLSEETKKKMSKRMKMWHSIPENKEKHRRIINQQDIKEKMSKSAKKSWTLERKEEQRKIWKKNNPMFKPEGKEKMSKSWNDLDVRKERIKGMKESWKDLKIRRKRIESIKIARKEICNKKKQEYEKAKQENDFLNMRYDDLYEKAKEFKIYKRGSMCKQELIELLQEVL